MNAGPLIIGYEDTDEGADALALGVQLAAALDARPLIVQAVAAPEPVLTSPQLTAALKKIAEGRLETALAQLPDHEADAEAVASTSAARALHELAEEGEAIAIVVGSTDRGSIGRLVPGSTAERLLHGATCAVAVAARGYGREEVRPLRVAVAYDGSAEAALALDAGERIARRCNSTLTLLTVVGMTSAYYAPAGGATVPVAELERGKEKQARDELDKGIARVSPGLAAHGRLLHGAPGQALVEVSEDFDLIVVGSRGYGPLRRTILGSTSRRLFGGSRCSVLAVPRGSGSLAEADEPEAEGARPSETKARV